MRDVAMFFVPLCLYGCIWILMDIAADNLYIRAITDKTVPVVRTIKRVHYIRAIHISLQFIVLFNIFIFVPELVEQAF